MPEFNVSLTAVAIAVFANFFLGFIWYTPLFGKTWALEMGLDPEQKPSGTIMARGMVFMLVGNFLMAWVLGHNMAAYNPVTWGLSSGEMNPLPIATMAAFFTWLGFYLPVDIGVVAWEGKSWKLFFINTSYHFLMLFVAANLLAVF